METRITPNTDTFFRSDSKVGIAMRVSLLTSNVKKIIESNVKIKVNESRYIALFVVRKSIKKLFSIYYVNIYLFSIFFSMDFARQKGVGLPHIDYTMIDNKPYYQDFFFCWQITILPLCIQRIPG